jgi:ubiquinone/menaquinone biosynthesis C-methylase UbiE
MLTSPERFKAQNNSQKWLQRLHCEKANVMTERNPEETGEGWDSVVDTYEKAFQSFTTQFVEEALRLADLKPGQEVLDVAAGTGALTLAAAKAGADVTAIDFSPKMVNRLRVRLTEENLSNASALVMDGQALDLPDESFDAVFSAFGVMFFPDRDRGFKEMRRVLRRNGCAGIIVWASPLRLMEFFRQAMEETVPEIAPPQPVAGIVALQDADRLVSEMSAAGFRNINIHTVSRVWTTPSPDWLWQHATGFNPTIADVFDHIDAEKKNAVEAAFVRNLSDEFGEGPVRIERQAHIAISGQ